MKKRKLLETLKELIETNAQLSAQNEELWARVGKESEQSAEAPINAQPQPADKDYEKLESDNRILSQELIEAKAKILELTKQLENTSLQPEDELVTETAEQEPTETEVEETAIIDDADKNSNTEISDDDNINLLINISPSIDAEPHKPEINETDFVVKPIFDSDDSNTDDDVSITETAKDATPPIAEVSTNITEWQIDMASQYIGKAIIMITEFNNEIADYTSENKQDLITLALGKSEGFKAEIVDVISSCETPETAEVASEKRIDELKRYINALRLSV